MVNDMKELDRRGFTLIELLTTIIFLAIIMGIGAYSITAIFNTTKEKDYEKLVGEIKNAVELYYQECKYVNDDCDEDSKITLGFLITNGYLKGNSVDNTGKSILVNPMDKVNISECEVKYFYNSGKIDLEAVGVGLEGANQSCPTIY